MAEIEIRARPDTPRVEFIDALRFFAAASVVGFHWLYNGIAGGKVTSLGAEPLADVARFGSVGVAQFFVISGFVIGFSASRGTAGRFAAGRALRLFPAFWAAAGLTTLVIVIWGAPEFEVSPLQLLANLTMLPQYLGQEPIDGVYWTLTLELIFYAAIFVVVLLGGASRLATLFPAWALAMLGAAIIGLDSLPLLGGYYCYFAGGACIDAIRRQGATVYRLLGLCAAIATSVMFTLDRMPAWGTPALDVGDAAVRVTLNLLCFASVALALIPAVASFRLPLAARLGSLTYPMYLLHAHIGYVTLNALATPSTVWIVLPLMFVALIAASWALHEFVEVRLGRFWKGIFDRVLRDGIDSARRRAVDAIAALPSARRRPSTNE